MKINIQDTVKSDILRNTKNHTMEVKKDDGLYRHLRFSNNGDCIYRYDLITWPGNLVITGDMGSYHFARIEDMFHFFHSGTQAKELQEYKINKGYWAEKLQSGTATAFSMDVFKEVLWS